MRVGTKKRDTACGWETRNLGSMESDLCPDSGSRASDARGARSEIARYASKGSGGWDLKTRVTGKRRRWSQDNLP